MLSFCKGCYKCWFRLKENCISWTWKENFACELFDANELLNNVKTENMLLLDKVKNLELELSVTREQIDRSASSKLDHMLSAQKSPSDKTGLGFVESISVPAPHSTNFVPSSSFEPPVSEVLGLLPLNPIVWCYVWYYVWHYV